ncbi:carbon-nitrogen hydrolase family protein [Rhizobium tubonense]|uniref:CN hydrolase domain-containing protein n=1 Tax=Rhizobium tubonense TaxID=484088 RepID=A0A2W4CYG7_9HYPH|nr:carbon-nitrogen hydrolase family protein [Rhizobium tubonense]PZM17179.1 hypothetical protein CPY51_02835 [Rhizobium tubonense]
MVKWDGSYTWHKPPSMTGAPDRLKVATCQFPVLHDVSTNTREIIQLIAAASLAGADVAHFPECAISGYGPENWPDWSGFDWDLVDAAVSEVRAAASRHGIWIAAGCVYRDNDRDKPLNSVYLIDRRGAVSGRYDKQACSQNDLRAFSAGRGPARMEIEGVRCGFLICRDWQLPELWHEYDDVELVLHSACSDGQGRDKNETHTIPPLIQSYSRLHQFAVSSSNSCRPSQDYPSLWVERSGHMGKQATRHETGFIVNALADDPEQDRFFEAVRASLRDERARRATL